MGLLDILNGMQNGPRGQSQPSVNTGSKGGGMSPIMTGLLGLLAYKAFKGTSSQPAAPGGLRLPSGGTMNAGSPGGGIGDILGGLLGGKPAPAGAKPSGGLGDMIPGGLGGLLGGGAASGTVLSGGLGNLMKQLQDSGQSRAAQSWVGTGPNQKIAPDELAAALGNDTIDALTKHTGLGRADLLAGLSQHLPDLVNQLTPNGRLPTEEEAARMI